MQVEQRPTDWLQILGCTGSLLNGMKVEDYGQAIARWILVATISGNLGSLLVF